MAENGNFECWLFEFRANCTPWRRIEDTRIEACVYTIFFNLGRRGRSIDVALIHGALNEMDAPSFPSRYPSPFRFPFAVKEETRKEDSVKAKKRLKFANITETVLPRIAFGF